MIIVSDTSAITALIQIRRAEILTQLYQSVIIPTEVEQELRRHHAGLPAFIQVLPVSDRARFLQLTAELDAGEAAAITLMLEGCGDLLLMDERRGRSIAEREHIPVVGLLGVLLEAKIKGLIPSLAAVIAELENTVQFRISSHLKSVALQRAGEQ